MKQELTPKIIYKKIHRLFSLIMIICICTLTFFPMGVHLIFTALFSDSSIELLIPGIICLTIGSIPTIIHIKNDLHILHGEYEIREDILRQKGISRDSDSDTHYNLFFENYYSTTNRVISVDRKLYEQYHTGTKFYLVILGKQAFEFSTEKYQISDSTQIKPFATPTIVESTPTSSTQNIAISSLTKDIIKKDFLIKGGHLKTIIVLFLCNVFLAMFALFMFNIKEASKSGVFISCSIMAFFFLFFLITKTTYAIKIISRINHDKFQISTEKIIKIGDLDFVNSVKIVKFKTEKYDKYIYADRDEFPDPKEGDYCHLVLVEKEDVVLRAYNPKKWVKIN